MWSPTVLFTILNNEGIHELIICNAMAVVKDRGELLVIESTMNKQKILWEVTGFSISFGYNSSSRRG